MRISIPDILTISEIGDQTQYSAKMRERVEQRFREWRKDKIDELRVLRNRRLRLYHRALSYVLHHRLVAASTVRVAILCEEHEQEFHALDLRIDELLATPEKDLRIVFNREPRHAA